MSRYQPIWRRIMDKVRVDVNGCWMWQGAKDRGNHGIQYGQVYWNGKLWAAHRATYTWYVAPIPEGYEVDHLCKNGLCVNPRHLDAVPPRINMLRSDAPGAIRWKSAYCKRGHPMVEANLFYHKRGDSECKTCLLIRNLKRAKKNWDRTVVKYKFTGEAVHVRL